ncbi:LPXTG cell wall anchor domain-containing protein [Streptococcus sp. X16XC17]|nr:LPXTG cell wall anchor domain-containing protein [Streptococcus sp. X13SY08]TCD45816.1 LPXTG cell wall anchor domain-containing protein [Streptococcus sp. X16XC17]
MVVETAGTPAVYRVGSKKTVQPQQSVLEEQQTAKSGDKVQECSTMKENKNVLPKTGEQMSIFTVFGAVLLAGVAGILTFRRKKE